MSLAVDRKKTEPGPFVTRLVAVLVMWAWSSPHPTALVAVEASVTPIDMMERVGKDLRDETPREPS